MHKSISKLPVQVQSYPKLPKQHHKTNPTVWGRCDCWFLQIYLQWWEQWGHTLQRYGRSPSICGPRVLRLAANTRLTADLMWDGITKTTQQNNTSMYTWAVANANITVPRIPCVLILCCLASLLRDMPRPHPKVPSRNPDNFDVTWRWYQSLVDSLK